MANEGLEEIYSEIVDADRTPAEPAIVNLENIDEFAASAGLDPAEAMSGEDIEVVSGLEVAHKEIEEFATANEGGAGVLARASMVATAASTMDQ